MKSVVVTIRGERYITLDAAAECYQCEVTWVEQVYAFGLLGRGEPVGAGVAIRTSMLDRLARLVALCRYQGLELDTAAAFLLSDEE